MCKKIQRRNALLVIFIGSVPLGLWLKLDCMPKKDDFVQVIIDAFSSTEWVPSEYFRKNMWCKRKPFLKLVTGSHGDTVELAANGLILH